MGWGFVYLQNRSSLPCLHPFWHAIPTLLFLLLYGVFVVMVPCLTYDLVSLVGGVHGLRHLQDPWSWHFIGCPEVGTTVEWIPKRNVSAQVHQQLRSLPEM